MDFPIELQCLTQLLDVIGSPHHSIREPRDRGFTLSEKQPAEVHPAGRITPAEGVSLGDVLIDEVLTSAVVDVLTGVFVEVEDSFGGWGGGARTTAWPFRTVVAPHPDCGDASAGPA